ncbi:hypothetical protein LTR64_003810 [Lithohypha guttulata]|uniref:uncharacterized protein n=1 Tax=Lithohypha guttulata TaxID=1690604 RepID=UPI002DE1AC8F|nr:hypothetical protein LTR51_006848 [Lithohypha guttulata]
MSTISSTPVLESKSAKKRKAKVNPATTPPPAETPMDAKVNGTADHEAEANNSRQIRNSNKKLASITRTEAIINDAPGVSLDDLIKQKKINNDQKAQILKKPQIEAQLAQLEEQQKNFSEFAQDLEARHDKEKASLAEAHNAEIEKVKQEAVQGSSSASTMKVQEALRITCQFLHAVASHRQNEDLEENEKEAYEAVLHHLYQGNHASVETVTHLVEGREEKISDPNTSKTIDYTFAQLKASAVSTPCELAANADGDAVDDSEAAPVTEDTDEHEETETDQTVANAGLTELEDNAAVPIAEEATSEELLMAAPEQSSTTADAANAVAEASWNPEASMTTENTQTGEDWVQVPRDPAETETSATPAMNQSTTNWADEAGAAAEATATEEKGVVPISENDGFSEVRRDRGGRGRGGRGRGSDGRGRGRGRGGEFRGNRGGRGRGGPRGAAQVQAA